MNLKELASKLGLSPTTVSRALNGYPEVNETTRERAIHCAGVACEPRKMAVAEREFGCGFFVRFADYDMLIKRGCKA